MGLLGKAKQLDDAVLGPSDSTRGFVFNVLSGLHPGLVPVWFAVAAVCGVIGVVRLVSEDVGAGTTAVVAAAACAFMGYVSRRMPPTPRR